MERMEYPMKKQYFSDALVYGICMIAAALLNLAVSGLIVKIVTLLIAPEFFVLAIVRAVVGFLTGAVVLGLVIGCEGYKSVSFSAKQITVSVLIASVGHFLLSFLLRFYPFVSGGTRYLGGLLEHGSDFDGFAAVADVALWAYIAAFWIIKLGELVLCLVAGKCGMKARIKSRESIDGYPHNAEQAPRK